MKPLVTANAAMTLACPDPQGLARSIAEAWGWEEHAAGAIDAGLEELWGIAPGSAGDRYVVLRAPGANHGMLRLVAGGERDRQRQRAARWAGFEIVVMRDIDALYEAMGKMPGVVPFGPPQDYDFSGADSNIHRAFSARLPGGTHVTLTMAVTQPKGRKFPRSDARVGHIFEVPLNTPNYPACRGLYGGALAMSPVLETRSTDGPMHAAWKIPAGPVYHLDILRGDAPDPGLGAIEIHGIDAAYIDPDPARADRFDPGACMATFTTTDLETVAVAVGSLQNVTVVSRPRAVAAAPYNGAHAFAFLGPDGERVEVCEGMWA